MFKINDLVKFASFVGIVDAVFVNQSDDTDIIYLVSWCKNAYQPKSNELIEAGSLQPATADELRERMAQLKAKYDSRVDDLLARLDQNKSG